MAAALLPCCTCALLTHCVACSEALKRLVAGGSGGLKTGAEYETMLQDRDQLISDLMSSFHAAGVDVLLLPPSSTPAVAHATTFLPDARWNYTAAFNITGFPAAVVPLGIAVHELDSACSAASDDGADAGDNVGAGAGAGGSASASNGDHGDYAGLPATVQVAGLPNDEDVVLAVVSKLEELVRAPSE